jgi:hypothetical protein
LAAAGPRLDSLDADELAAAGLAVLHLAGLEGKEREVPPDTDVETRVKEGSDLANQDIAGENLLAAKRFTPRLCDCESRPLRELP